MITRRFIYLGGLFFVCVLFAGVIFIYADYVSSRAMPTRPLVTIIETIPDGGGVTSQPIVVFAQADDPDGIARVELWINGQQVGAQENSDPNNLLTFETSQAWIPNGAGNYLIVLKALDRAGFLGESDPLIMEVQDRKYEVIPQVNGEYRVQEGETLESIANSFGTTPADLLARNPGVSELPPGSSVLVPPRPEGEMAGEAAVPPVTGGDDVRVVDPPPPPPAPGGETEADPVSEPWWTALPLPEHFVCLLNPDACRRAIDLELAPSAASGVDFARAEGCGINVSWTDTSENEDGFRIYRFTNRPHFRIDLLEMVSASPGAGTRLSYLDVNPPRGEFFYAIGAYNAGGDIWSAPSPMVESEGCPPAGPIVAQPLVIEALAMNVTGSFDRLYCYASLAGSSFERIPAGALSFITLEAGTWNIAEHFSGVNKRELMASAIDPLTIIVECMGWQGEELINMGRFTRSHPPEEWDGRPLMAGPDSGGYSVTYRIQPSFQATDERGHAAWPLVDPRASAPYNLRTGRVRCPGIECDMPLLRWDYTPTAAVPTYSLFKVYRRLPGSSFPALYRNASPARMSTALPTDDCTAHFLYSVSAVVGYDPITGEEIQSPLSEEFEILPTCGLLEVTLESMWVYGVDDGDPCTVFGDCRDDYEAYGWFDFNGQRIRWNDHCDSGFFDFEGCVYVGPSYTSVLEASPYNWSDAMLNTGDGWRRGNNVIEVFIRDGEALRFMFTLIDHDDGSADERWCGSGTGRPDFIVPARSASEWLSTDELFEVDTARRGGNCIIRFRVRGMR